MPETRTTEDLKPCDILTAIDASGQRHAVTFGFLQNGGNGNGVLLDLNLTDPTLPLVLAFGDTRCVPAALPLVLAFGDNRYVPIDAPGPAWVFYSYARMQPALRGAPVHGHPGREAILLMRD